jgi:hypothetical protein
MYEWLQLVFLRTSYILLLNLDNLFFKKIKIKLFLQDLSRINLVTPIQRDYKKKIILDKQGGDLTGHSHFGFLRGR